tara:strand:- start:172 stop:471 length:300 start_codon:yes stop_codon:yes gene_type:complete
MKRYSNNNIRVDKDGKRVYPTTYYPEIPIQNSDSIVTVKDGTRIDNLAAQYYNDVSLWWVIAKANGFKGKVVFQSGDLVRIPTDLSPILGKFEELNRVE